jgi:class 3 adenylate cyclase
MEPRIQYAKTSDGVSIAYWTLGEGGTPLVMTSPLVFSNISLEWRIPELSAWYRRLAGRGMVVRFDWRNMGMSERGVVVPPDIEQRASDLESVVDELSLGAFNLLAFGGPGMLTFPYLAHHPDRVSRLVLWSTEIRGRIEHPALLSLAQTDWDLVVETFAHSQMGWGMGNDAHVWAEFIRASITQSDFVRLLEVVPEMDASPYLERVGATTLVLYQPHRTDSEDHARELATRIPNAEIVRLGERPLAPYEHEEGKRVAEEFLGIAPEIAKAEETVLPPGMLAILFTDLVGHTEMMSRLGDDRGRDVLREHERITREVLKANGGTEVKTMGDGFMASFGSVTKAVECAIALQKAIEAGNQDSESPLARAAGEGKGVRVRVGLNAGEPIEEDGDLFGATVILASRIAAKADGGEILVADTVRGLCSGKGFLFADRGEFVAKGFEEPVRVYEVNWRG